VRLFLVVVLAKNIEIYTCSDCGNLSTKWPEIGQVGCPADWRSLVPLASTLSEACVEVGSCVSLGKKLFDKFGMRGRESLWRPCRYAALQLESDWGFRSPMIARLVEGWHHPIWSRTAVVCHSYFCRGGGDGLSKIP
jgi:hypothetical protein